MLMAHLHASFRSAHQPEAPDDQTLAQANRLFFDMHDVESLRDARRGPASGRGAVQICNAGHSGAARCDRTGVIRVEPGGLRSVCSAPSEYPVKTLQLAVGDTLPLYTDGLTETGTRGRGALRSRAARKLLALSHDLTPQGWLPPACVT